MKSRARKTDSSPPRESTARLAREALGVSQREMSQLLGVPQSTVWRWEVGERDPGALGAALFALIADDPASARRVLQHVRGARVQSRAAWPSTAKPQATRRRTAVKPKNGLSTWPLLGSRALTTAQLHELMNQTATAIGSRDPAKLWQRLRPAMEGQALNYEEFKQILPWRSK